MVAAVPDVAAVVDVACDAGVAAGVGEVVVGALSPQAVTASARMSMQGKDIHRDIRRSDWIQVLIIRKQAPFKMQGLPIVHWLFKRKDNANTRYIR